MTESPVGWYTWFSFGTKLSLLIFNLTFVRWIFYACGSCIYLLENFTRGCCYVAGTSLKLQILLVQPLSTGDSHVSPHPTRILYLLNSLCWPHIKPQGVNCFPTVLDSGPVDVFCLDLISLLSSFCSFKFVFQFSFYLLVSTLAWKKVHTSITKPTFLPGLMTICFLKSIRVSTDLVLKNILEISQSNSLFYRKGKRSKCMDSTAVRQVLQKVFFHPLLFWCFLWLESFCCFFWFFFLKQGLISQAGLELVIFLPRPSIFWGYSYVPHARSWACFLNVCPYQGFTCPVLTAGFGCFSPVLSCSDFHWPLRAYGIGRVREIVFPFEF